MQETHSLTKFIKRQNIFSPILVVSKQSSPLSSFGPCLSTVTVNKGFFLRKNNDDDLHSLRKTKIIAHENRLSQNGSNISSLQMEATASKNGQKYSWLVVSTHLKNMLVKLDHFPKWG